MFFLLLLFVSLLSVLVASNTNIVHELIIAAMDLNSFKFNLDNIEEDLDEEFIKDKPWALEMLSSCQKMTKVAVLKWIKLSISIDPNEKNNTENIGIFKKTIQKLYEELLEDMGMEYQMQLVKVEGLYCEIKNLEEKLHLPHSAETKPNISLLELQKIFKKQIKEYKEICKNKENEAEGLKEEYNRLATQLGRSPKSKLLHSETLVNSFKEQIEELKMEFITRESRYHKIKENIQNIIEETGIDAKEILQKNDPKLTDEAMKNIEDYYETIMTLKDNLYEEISVHKSKLEKLWDLLDFPLEERVSFLTALPTNNTTTLSKLKSILAEMEQYKCDHLKTIIECHKKEVESLWEQCFCGATVKNEFPCIYTNIYNEETLENFAAEIIKWRSYYENNKEILQKVEKYQKLQNSLSEMNINSENVNKNRGGSLLTLIRKKNTMDAKISRIEKEVLEFARSYYRQNRCHFMVFDQTIEDYIEKYNKKMGLNVKPKKECSRTPNATPKKKLVKTPQFSSSRKATPKQKPSKPATLPRFKLNYSRVQVSPPRKRWEPSKINLKSAINSEEESWTTDYSEFEKEMKKTPRSTSFRGEPGPSSLN